jgi:glycerol-3-phosphate dehydrogenase (NAD(P)+)
LQNQEKKIYPQENMVAMRFFMRNAVLGLGMWGFCLARLLAKNGHTVIGWTKETDILAALRRGEDHPTLSRSCRGMPIELVDSIEEAIENAEVIVESVTTGGLRSVLSLLHKRHATLPMPFVLTSKGIEQNTHKTPPDCILEIFGNDAKQNIAMLSGPSFAAEVMKKLPTAVVCGAYEPKMCELVINLFSSNAFKIYSNYDIRGVALGGALKNVIAIACGIAEGLELGIGARSTLITRGLHEMVKLAIADGCQAQTLYGLSGLGDLYLTCSSPLSRNFRFGLLLSAGLSRTEAEKQIGMIVEGAYTCLAARELAELHHVDMPITEAVYEILKGSLPPADVISKLMQCSIREERL